MISNLIENVSKINSIFISFYTEYKKDLPVAHKNKSHVDFGWDSCPKRVHPLFHPYQGNEDSLERLESHSNKD